MRHHRTSLATCMLAGGLLLFAGALPALAGEGCPPAPPPEPTAEPVPEPSPPEPSEPSEFERGQRDGMRYGTQVGKSKGTRDGKSAGDRDGYQAGLKDAEHGIDNPADPGQPPGGGELPVPPPTLPGDEPGDQPPAEEPPQFDETDVEAEALSRYPDLVPQSPRASLGARLRGALDDPEVQQGLEYTKGFAAGFAVGYAQAFRPAKEAAYAAAFRRGYARGQADWKRRNTDENGNVLTPEGQLARARAEFQRGNLEEAADRFDMVLARGQAGDLADNALHGLALCRFHMKDYPGCRKAVDRLVQTLPSSPLAPHAAFLRAGAFELEKKGGFFGIGARPDYEAAARAFQDLVLRYPTAKVVPEAYYRLGYVNEKLRRRCEAREAYETVLERWPEHPAAGRAERRLENLRPCSR